MTTQPISLCQVKEGVSCGACCGLYNVPAQDRSSLERLLLERTEQMERTPRTVSALDAFGANALAGLPGPDRPLPGFHHCPFLGLIGENLDRPGCLLHPEAPGNKGRDYRGLSHYGGAACRLYFCPSHYRLPERLKGLVIEAAEDWYLYGAVITEHRLLKGLIQGLEAYAGGSVPVAELAGSRCNDLARQLLALKLNWPFRKDRQRAVCHYVFEDGPYARTEVDYERLRPSGSGYDVIFRELESSFASALELKQAEAKLEDLFKRLTDCIHTYSKCDSSSP